MCTLTVMTASFILDKLKAVENRWVFVLDLNAEYKSIERSAEFSERRARIKNTARSYRVMFHLILIVYIWGIQSEARIIQMPYITYTVRVGSILDPILQWRALYVTYNDHLKARSHHARISLSHKFVNLWSLLRCICLKQWWINVTISPYSRIERCACSKYIFV